MEIQTRKNSVFGHFSSSDLLDIFQAIWRKILDPSSLIGSWNDMKFIFWHQSCSLREVGDKCHLNFATTLVFHRSKTYFSWSQRKVKWNHHSTPIAMFQLSTLKIDRLSFLTMLFKVSKLSVTLKWITLK